MEDTTIEMNSFGKVVSELLPPDWFVSPDNYKSEEATFNYLAPDFTFLCSTRSAQTYMKSSRGMTGWKTRVMDWKMKKKFFLAPDGSSFLLLLPPLWTPAHAEGGGIQSGGHQLHEGDAHSRGLGKGKLPAH